HFFIIENINAQFNPTNFNHSLSFLLYLFQVLLFKLKAGDEWLCVNTKYSLTLRLVPPPSSFD
ncbi:hypothetical protein KP732_12265, partial [Lactococcus lactis]|uniref:hypothetical protein n=1 Tax=Lactococcus lactis TaxID=1358 RepID=UPI001C0AA3E5